MTMSKTSVIRVPVFGDHIEYVALVEPVKHDLKVVFWAVEVFVALVFVGTLRPKM